MCSLGCNYALAIRNSINDVRASGYRFDLQRSTGGRRPPDLHPLYCSTKYGTYESTVSGGGAFAAEAGEGKHLSLSTYYEYGSGTPTGVRVTVERCLTYSGLVTVKTGLES